MEDERLAQRRHAQENLWVDQAIRARFGSLGLRAMRDKMVRVGRPFWREHAISNELLTPLGF